MSWTHSTKKENSNERAATGNPGAVVTYLIPRGCRENVAGDLREQYRSTAQDLVRALRIMPVVIASRAWRAFDPVFVTGKS
jgi:hypothetical protein